MTLITLDPSSPTFVLRHHRQPLLPMVPMMIVVDVYSPIFVLRYQRPPLLRLVLMIIVFIGDDSRLLVDFDASSDDAPVPHTDTALVHVVVSRLDANPPVANFRDNVGIDDDDPLATSLWNLLDSLEDSNPVVYAVISNTLLTVLSSLDPFVDDLRATLGVDNDPSPCVFATVSHADVGVPGSNTFFTDVDSTAGHPLVADFHSHVDIATDDPIDVDHPALCTTLVGTSTDSKTFDSHAT